MANKPNRNFIGAKSKKGSRIIASNIFTSDTSSKWTQILLNSLASSMHLYNNKHSLELICSSELGMRGCSLKSSLHVGLWWKYFLHRMTHRVHAPSWAMCTPWPLIPVIQVTPVHGKQKCRTTAVCQHVMEIFLECNSFEYFLFLCPVHYSYTSPDFQTEFGHVNWWV